MSTKRHLRIGIDVGSTTVKVVALDPGGRLVAHRYARSNGRPREALLSTVEELGLRTAVDRITSVGVTGSGGGSVAGLIGGRHRNELVAQTRAVAVHHPEARTVIEIGGQDSKLLVLESDADGVRLADFSMNALCAAGTGSFLDQQAERLGIDIEGEFAGIALRSENPARVAGRCTVFAKSDMIHLQQKGVPLPDILAGVCLALARNFRTIIGKGKPFRPPILFQGGVAWNRAVVRAFETVLELEPGELVVPEHHELMAAIGTAMMAGEGNVASAAPFGGFDRLAAAVREGVEPASRLAPLAEPAGRARTPEVHRPSGLDRVPVDVGIDVGSISTKVVLIDECDRVLARRYLMTAGRPLEIVRRGLREVGEEVADRIDVRGVGVTGSGRYLTADFVGADVVRNEITAQARAAVAFDPAVDTIFEIGGQDSKYVRIREGAVVDFAMNSACAAGTGSFLQEQSDRLKIDVARDFGRLALESRGPVELGERCTVFMESDLVHHQQRGASVRDLTGGLAYSIALNYLNRVVEGRPVGERILFQGGVAWNPAVTAAFEALLERSVTVPAHHDVSGAIGAAILAREARSAGEGTAKTAFRGFDLSRRTYASSTFECRACPNLCEVSRIVLDDEPPIFHGARCDKFEEAGRKRNEEGLPDLFAERDALLLAGYREPGARDGRPRVGLPRALLTWELAPYWIAFFEALGIEPVLSDPSSPALVRRALDLAAAETCFPVKLMYGHVENVVEKDVDWVFLPSVVNRARRAPGQRHSQSCPYVASVAQVIAAGFDFGGRARPLAVTLERSWATGERSQLRELAPTLRSRPREIVRAVRVAEAAQGAFRTALRERGERALRSLDPNRPTAVVVGRPYNTCDPGACLDVPGRLRKIGVLPIPMDYLDLSGVDVSARYGNMFWKSGQDILSAAAVLARRPSLQTVYLTNFGCGPDSFLIGFFGRLLQGRPFLELEIDEHTATAGIETRCEAFFDSVR